MKHIRVLFSATIILLGLFVTFIPMFAFAVGSYGVDLTSSAYQSDVNPFYASGYGGSSIDGYDGECTWYAWGRAYEKLGIALPCRRNANDWPSEAENEGFSVGTEARANSIMVEHYDGTGHVFFVETVENGYAYVTEGNWNGYYHEDAINLSTLRRDAWKSHPMGSIEYIYLTGNNSFDTTPPVVNVARKQNVSSKGYDVVVEATDNTGVSKLVIGTWHSKMSVHDAVWDEAVPNQYGRAILHVRYSSFNNERNAEYYTNAYAIDSAGNWSKDVRVYSYEDLGDDFYATIIKDSSGGFWENTNNVIKISEATGSAYDTDPNRVWHFIKQKTGDYVGSYEIICESNNRCVDISCYGSEDGTSINLLDRAHNAAQRFYICLDTQKEYPRYYFRSVYCNSALDVSGPYVSSGGTIQLWHVNNTNAQLFQINDLEGKPVEKHKHFYRFTTTKEPACTKEGIGLSQCIGCGLETTVKIAALGHDFFDGVCRRCGAACRDHAHQYAWSTFKQPTCTKSGYEIGICSCGNKTQRTLDTLGHDYVDGVCSRCGAKKEEPHSHSYKWVTTKQPTCTEAGYETGACSCGETATRTLEALGHSIVDGVCSRCNMRIKRVTNTNEHEHKYLYSEITEYATCTEPGYWTETCECGDTKTTEIPALGHNFVDGFCTRCGATDPPHSHSYSWTVTQTATCISPGYETGICSCGDTTTRTLSALGHNYVNDVCSICGEFNPNHTHSFTWNTVQATCVEDGVETGTCACGYQTTQVIPALGHNYVDGVCTRCGNINSSSVSVNESDESVPPADTKISIAFIPSDYYVGVKIGSEASP